MKPIIIFKQKNREGKYTFTEEELRTLLEETYDEGYKEGRGGIYYPISNAPTTNPNAPITNPTIPTAPWWDRFYVTCGEPKLNTELTTSTAKPNSNIKAYS